jgi:glycosyltransferase involved in cell wall biosynthesis
MTTLHESQAHRGTSLGGAGISVALCTYNGERFLQTQLSSILDQTRLPDEVILCDDASSDRTLEIAAAFAEHAPFPVRIVRNESNLGSNRNFQQAIELCSGELIVLSDQDDVWVPERLERSECELRKRPGCGLVFSDATVIDDEGHPTGNTLWQNFAFTPELQERMRKGSYTPLAHYRFITGATVMFRSEFRPFLFPILGEWIHDGWIAMLIACLSGVCFISEPLVQYRQHTSQQVGLRHPPARKPRTIQAMAQRHWSYIDAHRVILADVVAAFDRLPLDRTRGAAADFLRHYAFLSKRLALPSSRVARLPRMLGLRDEYRIGASSRWSVPKDLVLPKRTDEHGAAARSGFSLFAKPESAIP